MKLFDARAKVGGNPLEKLYTSLRRHPKLEKSFRQLAENSRGGRAGEEDAGALHRDRYSRFSAPPLRQRAGGVHVDA